MKRNFYNSLFFLFACLLFVACNNTSDTIHLISREDGSGTRTSFVEIFDIVETNKQGHKKDKTYLEAVIANKTDVMITNITTDKNAIGYVSLGSLNETIKALKINGVEAKKENIKNGTYSISRSFNVVVKNEISNLAEDFIAFILSEDGQKIVDEKYVAVNNSPKKYVLNNISGKLIIAGSSSVAPVVEKLKEAYEYLNQNVEIELQITDSTSGILGLVEGTCDIGLSSRALKESEKQQLKEVKIALDALVLIVNKKNKIDNLSQEDVKLIFTGKIQNWKQLVK